MIRIVCPHCHVSLSALELEHASINGGDALICPECASVLVSDSVENRESHSLAEHYPDELLAHA